MTDHEIMISKLDEILTILKGENFKEVNKEIMDDFDNTDPTSSTIPYLHKDAFSFWWKPMIDQEDGEVFIFGEYGYFKKGTLIDIPVLYWFYDELNNSPEILGEAADLRVLADDIYPMFNEILKPLFGNDWSNNYKVPDQAGMSTFDTGIPYRFPCGLKSLNKLK